MAVYAFDITGNRIKHIWVVLNPRHAPALGDRLTLRERLADREVEAVPLNGLGREPGVDRAAAGQFP